LSELLFYNLFVNEAFKAIINILENKFQRVIIFLIKHGLENSDSQDDISGCESRKHLSTNP